MRDKKNNHLIIMLFVNRKSFTKPYVQVPLFLDIIPGCWTKSTPKTNYCNGICSRNKPKQDDTWDVSFLLVQWRMTYQAVSFMKLTTCLSAILICDKTTNYINKLCQDWTYCKDLLKYEVPVSMKLDVT